MTLLTPASHKSAAAWAQLYRAQFNASPPEGVDVQQAFETAYASSSKAFSALYRDIRPLSAIHSGKATSVPLCRDHRVLLAKRQVETILGTLAMGRVARVDIDRQSAASAALISSYLGAWPDKVREVIDSLPVH